MNHILSFDKTDPDNLVPVYAECEGGTNIIDPKHMKTMVIKVFKLSIVQEFLGKAPTCSNLRVSNLDFFLLSSFSLRE